MTQPNNNLAELIAQADSSNIPAPPVEYPPNATFVGANLNNPVETPAAYNPEGDKSQKDVLENQYIDYQVKLRDHVRANPNLVLDDSTGVAIWRSYNGENPEDPASYVIDEAARVANDYQRLYDNTASELERFEKLWDGGSGGKGGGSAANAFMDIADIQAAEGDRAYKDYVQRVSDWAALNDADFERESNISDAFMNYQDSNIQRNEAIQQGLLTQWAPRIGFRPPPREEGFNNYASAIQSTIPGRAPSYVPYNGPEYVPRGFAGGTMGMPPTQPQMPPVDVATQGGGQACPNCGAPITPEAMQTGVCANCGSPLQPQQPPGQEMLEPDLQGKIAMGPAGMTPQQRLERYFSNAGN